MCINCCEGICQQRCVAGQQRGYRGEIIPSEAILFSEKTDDTPTTESTSTRPVNHSGNKESRHE